VLKLLGGLQVKLFRKVSWNHVVRAALVSALPGELKPALEHVKVVREVRLYGFTVAYASYGGVELLLASSAIGNVNMSMLITMMAVKLDMDTAVLVGTLGSAAPRLRVGKLLIPDTLAFYDQCLETDLGSIHFASYDRLPFSIRGFKPSRTVFNALIKASENLNVSSMRGIILTSDRFDAKSSTWRDIRMKVPWRIVGVDMESAAFAQACSRFGVRYGVVKVATDTVGPASPIQFIMNFRRLAPLPVKVALEAMRMIGSQG